MSLTKVTNSMIAGAVINVLDYGASPSASAADNLTAIQSAVNAAGTVVSNLFNYFFRVEECEVYIPSGTYEISGTLQLPPGVMLTGDGSQSTILKHNGGLVNCIEAGMKIYPNGLPADNFTKMGGIKQLSIQGTPDTTYNPLTVAGKIGKTNQTVYGIKLDGAWGYYLIQDVDIFYCQTALWVDNSWYLEALRVRCFNSTNHGAIVYGSNLFKFENCQFSNNTKAGVFIDRRDLGSGEITKSSKFVSCGFESNLEQGAYVTNYNTLEFNSCYFENNMLYNSLYPATANQEFLIDTNANYNNILTMTNNIFNCFVQTGENVDVVYFKKGVKINFSGNSVFATEIQNSLIRVGQVQQLNVNTNNIYGNVAAGVGSDVIYDIGTTVIVNTGNNTTQFKNFLPNGQLQSWQKATSATTSAGARYPAADMWSIYDYGSGSIDVSQQTFNSTQTDVPGYPQYYLKMEQTLTSTSWGVYFKPAYTQFFGKYTTLSFGFWAKADAEYTVSMGSARIQNGTTTLPGSQTKITIGTSWKYYSLTSDLYQDLTLNPEGTNSFLLFSIDLGTATLSGAGTTTGTFYFANAQCEVGSFPSSISKVLDQQNLANCQQWYVNTGTAGIIYSGNVSSGSTYKTRVNFPQPMRVAPTVTINAGSNSNMAGSVSVTNITTIGFDLSIGASGSGYGEYIAGYEAVAYM